jgi:transcriptional regulator with XRE-family HTH domain
MDSDKLKIQVGSNIAAYRKRSGLTQAELAQKLNYTDKAVSKWERGESLPDVLTLLNLAQQLGTDLNTLTGTMPESAEAEPKPATEIPAVKAPEKPKKPRRYTADRSVIQKLSSILVWVVALFLYMLLEAFGVKNLWLLFVAAVPANAIVLLSLRSAWKCYGWNRILISVILWGSLLTLYLFLLTVSHVNVWRILPMGLLGQAAILLWFKMFRPVKEDNNE